MISKLIGTPHKIKGTLVQLESYGIIKSSTQKSDDHKIIYLNSESIRERIEKSDLNVESTEADQWENNHDVINIYSFYEQNIGIITPHVAELIKEAENLYPVEWIEDAIKQSLVQNKRNWAYISSILNRWKIEGRDNGEHKGHNRQTRYR